MAKELLYLAGPYRAGNGRTVRANIRAAEEWAVKLWRMGYVVFSPHLNTAFMDGECSDETWLEGDLVILERCDLMAVLPGWEDSFGTNQEIVRMGNQNRSERRSVFFLDDPKDLALLEERAKRKE